MSHALAQLLEATKTAPVVPVLVVEKVEHAAPLASALAQGGLRVAEVTLRTGSALQVIEAMKRAEPDMIVGAGTVLSGEDVEACVRAGADFLVSPGMSPSLLAALGDHKDMMIPGVATASEAMARNDDGFEVLKLFPASIAGGAPALKALAGPLPHLRFMPTGGVTEQNKADYLSLPNVVAVGGSWIATGQDIRDENWGQIRQKARQAVSGA